MDKERLLRKIVSEIDRCAYCKRGGTGKAVAGEGSATAAVVLVGEAPGKEEAKIGRPFIGRSGKFLRSVMTGIGLGEQDVFITSPVHYLPLRGTPTKAAIIHGRQHLFRQIQIIDPKIVVLLGNTACIAMLNSKQELSRLHGRIVRKDGRMYFITFHPAYAMRFPEGKAGFIRDFAKLKKLIKTLHA
jgi:uracil-DNA glycosylase family 4